jgi:hypothetical protein
MRSVLATLALLLAPSVTLANTQYAKVAIVAKSGGYYDYLDPISAISDIATWCGTPSATNPCLIKIMPGVYDLTTSWQGQPYVDIEGSGENVTMIRFSGDDPNGQFQLYQNEEARFLSLSQIPGTPHRYNFLVTVMMGTMRFVTITPGDRYEAVWAGGAMSGPTPAILEHVTVNAPLSTVGVNYNRGNVILNHCSITASTISGAEGIVAACTNGGTLTLNDTTVFANMGVASTLPCSGTQTLRVNGSTIRTAGNWNVNLSTGWTTYILNSILDTPYGPEINGPGIACQNTWDANLVHSASGNPCTVH